MERRYCELRAVEGRAIEGVAVAYGDTARLPWGEERILPGAFGDVAQADVVMNAQHDRGRPLARTGGGGLALADTAQALIVRATLPDTRAADDVLALVRANILRGLSIEFLPSAERIEGRVRVITAASLRGVAVVDTPGLSSKRSGGAGQALA